MTLARHEGTRHEGTRRDTLPRRVELFNRFFDDLPSMLRHPVLLWPERSLEPLRVEEFTEDGALVIKVELAGIDPDRDVEISVTDDVLHIAAERRQEEEHEGRDYVRRELSYGSFQRDLVLPKGTSDAEVQATYSGGILEVRVPVPEGGSTSTRTIPVTKG